MDRLMQKYWVDEKTRCNCFVLFARALSITWGDDPRYWIWHPVRETKYVLSIRSACSSNYIYMHAQFSAQLDSSHVCTCTLSPSTLYSDAEIVEAASLQNVCWLEVHGRLELSHLTPGCSYDVAFQVMLTEPAYGWSVPVNLRLRFPDGTAQARKEKLQGMPTEQWLELRAGEVKAPAQPGGAGRSGELEISLFEYDGGLWKKGLLVKGIKIVPKESDY